MPNRIMNDSLCRSDSMAKLSWFDQCVFSRLIVLADDYGRYDARPAIIKGSGFPLHTELPLEEIQAALEHIADEGMIFLYEVDGKQYLELTSWSKFQRLRNSKIKYPPPPGVETRGNSPQLAATRGNSPPESQSNPNPCAIESNPIQSEINPNIESHSNPVSQSSKKDFVWDQEKAEAFEVFWQAYPKHKYKSTARAEFLKIDVPLETLMTALEAQKKLENWKKNDGQYIPAPAYWLRDERWKDDITGETSYGDGYTEELPI